MIGYLVGRNREDAADYAQTLGWTRIALDRYATPAKDDIRYIDHAHQLVTFGGQRGFPLYKSPNFSLRSEFDRSRFDMLVDDGTAIWTETASA
jgi:hypothetical protein